MRHLGKPIGVCVRAHYFPRPGGRTSLPWRLVRVSPSAARALLGCRFEAGDDLGVIGRYIGGFTDVVLQIV